jgi:FkbM family methyltransferase
MYQVMHGIKTKLSHTPEYSQYRIGQYVINLPAGHPLPENQAACRLYDRFLPILCSQLSPGGVIVDVGANIGDTVAAIMQACANRIIAIEGYRPYFDILLRNLSEIDKDHRVIPVCALVGPGARTGSLVASGSTAIFTDGGSEEMRPLDGILANWLDQVVLLKVDTDGLDADVISSGMNMIKSSQPMLFWEGGTSDATSFRDLYKKLDAAGYDLFWVFDNFGNLMLSECGIKELTDLDSYVVSQYRNRCTRTIFYVDVLASTLKTRVAARGAIAKYKREVIEVT